ncbi:MAG: hypothetical protein PHW47_00030 [Lachnospira sp.]|nr:hypothetical protein [Lachnospira sp.]
MGTVANIMEMMMVVCFGISWPLNIAKAWKAKTAKGTSVLFYFFIWIGYVFAFIGKFVMISMHSEQAWYVTVPWYVMFFYVVNIAMVSCGIVIYYRNKMLDSQTVKVMDRNIFNSNKKNKVEALAE